MFYLFQAILFFMLHDHVEFFVGVYIHTWNTGKVVLVSIRVFFSRDPLYFLYEDGVE